eukprot:Phypoly_transcript_10457.p1 GENE.Phypoly_transcript_10457~~Phypoly_transcript_10457.p1  ORF type:complete len:340 (+),score=33.49 Phypoly_transcript_10457:83-1102(+)
MSNEMEKECEKERVAALEAEEQQVLKDLYRGEMRKWVNQMKFLMEVERTADRFMESALVIDSSQDYPRARITAVVDGCEIRGSWELTQGTLPSYKAWLALCPKRSLNQQLHHVYVQGNSGTFRFKGLTRGQYEVRLYGDKFVSSCIAESATLLVGPKVLQFAHQIQDDLILFHYELAATFASNWDWIGIYEKGADSEKYLAYAYAKGGKVSLQLPRPAGTYEARLFLSGSHYKEQSTIEFTNPGDYVDAEFSKSCMTVNIRWRLWNVKPHEDDWLGFFKVLDYYNVIVSIPTRGAAFGEVELPIPHTYETTMYEVRHFPARLGENVIHTKAVVPITLDD